MVAAFPFPLAGGAFFITGTSSTWARATRCSTRIGVTPDKKVALDLELLRREGRNSQLEAATSYLKQKLRGAEADDSSRGTQLEPGD